MATRKPSTAKKSTTKKTTATKAAAKKPTTSTKQSAAKKSEVKSFRVAPETESFMTFRIGRQTIYWLIFGAAVIALTLWVATLQKNINELYDQIDATNAQNTMLSEEELKAYKEASDKKAENTDKPTEK